MVTETNVHTDINTHFNPDSGKWVGFSRVFIEVGQDFAPKQTEEFLSEEMSHEDQSTLLDLMTVSLEQAVNLSELLEDVDLDGENDLTAA